MCSDTLKQMHTAVYNGDLSSLVAENIPLLDVRSEIEFAKGALPDSVNLPILSTDERHQVGICYKRLGQAEAIKLGHSLVSGKTKSMRIRRWVDWSRDNPNGALLCWRGGLRSKTAQQWISGEGVNLPRIPGGYKAVRRQLLALLARTCSAGSFVVLAGETGVGKTALLKTLHGHTCALDLEHHARHRGSAFGAVFGSQPAQQTFENALISDLLKQTTANPGPVIIESESRMIGSLFIPDPLMLAMNSCDIAALVEPLEVRVENILRDYILNNPLGNPNSLGTYLEYCITKLSKRLGLERAKKLIALSRTACETNSPDQHRRWIRVLLDEYYDPYYAEYLRRNKERVMFRGNFEEVRGYLQNRRSSKKCGEDAARG